MCGCEFNVAGAGGTIAGGVHGHFSSRSDISAIYHSALVHCTSKQQEWKFAFTSSKYTTIFAAKY